METLKWYDVNWSYKPLHNSQYDVKLHMISWNISWDAFYLLKKVKVNILVENMQNESHQWECKDYACWYSGAVAGSIFINNNLQYYIHQVWY